MASATELKTTPAEKVAGYIEGVLSGEIVVGQLVRLAVQRHVRDLDEGGDRGLWFDQREPAFAIQFIELLKHSKGEWAGQHFILEPWQAFIVWVVFGWYKEDGTRRFKTAFASLGRKNGKSTLAAGIGLKLFVADNEPGAEVYTAATTRKQAKIVHEEAKLMVKASSLRTIVTTLRDNMSLEATNSKYEPLGSDADVTDGLNLSGCIIDEIHAHKKRTLWDVLETATGSRRNPLMFGITTAGDGGDRECIYWELKNYSGKVLEGSVEDDSWFAFIAALDDGDDWSDEAVWPKANPNLGVSVKIDDLRRKCRKAKETPAAVNNFRRKHCNEDTESVTSWITAVQWDACAGGDWYDEHGLRDDIREQYRGRACWVGGDLSSVSDLTALAVAFPGESDADTEPTVDVFVAAWCPRANALGRSRDRRVPYTTWADRGALFLTEGDSVDYDEPRAWLKNARDVWGWRIQEVALDPWNAQYLVTRLKEEDEFEVFEHKQGFLSMNAPCKTVERLVLDKKLRHGGHPVLRWCVSNCAVRLDPAGNIKLDKEKSGEKIDAAVAMVMAVGRAVVCRDAESVYETRGMLYAGEV